MLTDNNHVTGFDTLGAAKQLEESGLPRKSAETIVEVFDNGLASVVGQLATKADLQTTEATLKGDIGDLKGQIGDLKGDIGDLKSHVSTFGLVIAGTVIAIIALIVALHFGIVRPGS